MINVFDRWIPSATRSGGPSILHRNGSLTQYFEYLLVLARTVESELVTLDSIEIRSVRYNLRRFTKLFGSQTSSSVSMPPAMLPLCFYVSLGTHLLGGEIPVFKACAYLRPHYVTAVEVIKNTVACLFGAEPPVEVYEKLVTSLTERYVPRYKALSRHDHTRAQNLWYSATKKSRKTLKEVLTDFELTMRVSFASIGVTSSDLVGTLPEEVQQLQQHPDMPRIEKQRQVARLLLPTYVSQVARIRR